MEHKIGGRLHNPFRTSAESFVDEDTDESPILLFWLHFKFQNFPHYRSSAQ